MNGFAGKTDKKEYDLLEYVRIVVKRKWVLLTFAAVLFALADVMSFTTTPLYRATAQILIDEPGSSLLNIQDVLKSGGYYRTDYMGTYFNTQLRLFTSRSLAERVAKKINLGARPEFRALQVSRPGFLGRVKRVVILSWLFGGAKPTGTDTAQTSRTQAYASQAFAILGGLSILPVEETRLVYVSYVSPDPALAADIVNAQVEEFVSLTAASHPTPADQRRACASTPIDSAMAV